MKKGERARYRPQPRDFVQVYMREGFNGARLHFSAHWRNVQQWVEDNGGKELVDRRIKYLSSAGRKATINRIVGQRIRRKAEMRAQRDMMALVPLDQNGE